MTAALRHTSNFFHRLGQRCYVGRQAKADHEVNQRRYFYRYCDRWE